MVEWTCSADMLMPIYDFMMPTVVFGHAIECIAIKVCLLKRGNILNDAGSNNFVLIEASRPNNLSGMTCSMIGLPKQIKSTASFWF
jgi:hypothetical protein